MPTDTDLLTAARAVLQHWQMDYPPTMLRSSADGCALLALLCNAAAKDAPALYQYKAPLVTAACQSAPRNRWWIDSHRYARIVQPRWRQRLNQWWHRHTRHYLWSEHMTIVLLETSIHWQGDMLQLAFHFPAGQTLPDLPHPPAGNGRHWRGQRVQADAAAIATAWWHTQARTL